MSATVRTWAMLVVPVAASVVAWLVQRAEVLDAATAIAVGDWSQLVIVATAAALLLWASARFSAEERLRVQLATLGLGIGLWAVGQGVWTYYEVVKGVEVPYPGWPDVFFIAAYLPIAWALLSALRGFRRLTPTAAPIAVAVGLGAVTFASLWIVLLRESVVGTPVLEQVLGGAYPFLDLVVHVPLAAALVAVVSRMGGGRIAWPWWAVAVGLAIVALGDAAFTVTTASGTYATGSVIDLAWTLGFSTTAWGGALAVLVHKDGVAGGRGVGARGAKAAA